MNGPDLARAPEPVASLLARYSATPDRFDELLAPDGQVRPHWRPFVDALGGYSESALAQMWASAERLVEENGTTYNVYDADGDAARPWRMDPIPMLLDEAEWHFLERALIQRARLLNAIVDDIYGAQSLLTDGRLPAALVFGNPKFLRPMHGVRPPQGVHLHVLAFDVARGADDRWWVTSDRAQAPSGAGYALENRVVLSRTMPEVFRNVRAHRLAGFFQALSDGLLSLTRRDDPLIVLLTPGPMNETYFEHAYLARYLGFPLVEGADLTVRDNKVYLKTLNGLQQVDLILRRVDGDYCDPLELRNDSLLGVAGLVEAIRSGNVVVANGLGSGVVESEALMAFYPGLCRSLLGEDLLAPSIATWWCGQTMERDYVLDHLDRLIVRPTFGRTSIVNSSAGAIIPNELSLDELELLRNDIGMNSHGYFAQEWPSYSTTPIWHEGGFAATPMALRMFVCFDGAGYRVMPGGLARTTDISDVHGLRLGQASKDVWALSKTPVSNFSRLASPDQPIALRRSGVNLASRVADNLFWLGRYAERAENSVRLLRGLVSRLTGEAGGGDDPRTRARLVEAMIELEHLPESAVRLAQAGELHTLRQELASMLAGPTGANGLLDLLVDLHRVAALVRERLSVDSWRILNRLRSRAELPADAIHLDPDAALARLNAMLSDLAAFSGMQMENTIRSLSWRMLDMGRRVERALHMTTLLREMVVDGDPVQDGRLDLLLELGDSTMTYRTRYISAPRLAPVVDLLLTDDTNPRSIAFQAKSLAEHVKHLPREPNAARLSREEYLVELMNGRLRLADVYGLCEERDDEGARVTLQAFLNDMDSYAAEFSDVLARAFFSHVLPTRSAYGGSAQP